MKPTFLQDAIKANALKKIQKREKGEWKEPVVKQHKMTADEFIAAKQLEKPRSFVASPMLGSPMMMAAPSGPDPTTMRLLEVVQADLRTCKNENHVLRTELNKSKDELSSIRNEIKNCHEDNKKQRLELMKLQEIVQGLVRDSKILPPTSTKEAVTTSLPAASESVKLVQADVNKLQLDVSKLRDDFHAIQKENKTLKETIASLSTATNKSDNVKESKAIEAPRSHNPEPPKAVPASVAPVTPTSKKIKVSEVSAPKTPKTPKEPKSPMAQKTPKKESEDDKADTSNSSGANSGHVNIEPFTAEKLEHHQRKDEAFQKYIKTKEGLYPMKDMSIAEIDKFRIVCFRKLIYIPAKLREKIVQHYVNTYGIMAGTDKLRENCIWPSMDADIIAYR